MTRWSLRRLLVATCLLLGIATARAERIDEIVRDHLVALGGKERVVALSSFRATGQVLAGGQRLRFNMTVARPAKLRLETEAGLRTLVQGYSGEGEAWELDSGTWPPRYRSLAANAQKTFIADAEFDDPLVGGDKRGFKLEYTGEVKEGDRQLLRVQVTRRFGGETFALLIDPATYLIVWRIEDRQNAAGTATRVMTFYDDYRAVNGVLIAHRLSVAIDGKPAQQTLVERVEPNPKTTPETFARPNAGKSGAGR